MGDSKRSLSFHAVWAVGFECLSTMMLLLAALAGVALAPGGTFVAKAAAAVLLTLVYGNWSLLRSLYRYRCLPGPLPVPFLGNMLAYTKGNLHHKGRVWANKYKEAGAYKFFPMGSGCAVVVTDVGLAREIILRSFASFTNHPSLPKKVVSQWPKFVQNLSKRGLFGAKDTYWKGLRSTFNQIFHKKENVALFCPAMRATAEELADRLSSFEEGEVVNIWSEIGNMTLDVIGKAVFGIRFHCIERGDSDAVRATRFFFNSAGFTGVNLYALGRLVFPWATPLINRVSALVPIKAEAEMNWAISVLEEVCETMYAKAMSEKRGTRGVGEPAGDKGRGEVLRVTNEESFIRIMAHAVNKESGATLTKDEIIGNTFLLILAGYETTANTLAMCVYLLAANKDKEAKLIEEIDRVLGEENNGVPSSEHLDAYEYVEAVVKEGLRMFGPVNQIRRECKATTVVRHNNKEITLHKGDQVHVAVNAMHHFPEYFPDPEAFLPERFVTGNAFHAKQNMKAFNPFGMGPRMCVASKFAMQEAKLALIILYSKFKFTLKEGYEMETKMAATISAVGGVPVHVHPRT